MCIVAVQGRYYEPNQREQEFNRDFSNSLQYGFTYGLLKLAQGGTQDCTESGMSIGRDSIHLLRKWVKTRDPQDAENVWQFLIELETRCNYYTTLEGAVLSHSFRQWLSDRDGSGLGDIVSKVFLALEVIIQTADDALVLGSAAVGFKTHFDLYNVGLMLGRLTKMLTTYYLEGILFRKYRDYDF